MTTTIKHLSIYRVTIGLEQWLWLAIETADNRVGWGDASDSGDDSIVAHLIEQYAPQLIGCDINLANKMLTMDKASSYPAQSTNRFSSTAVSAIDQAIWDLRAQTMRVPLFAAIGSSMDGPIPLYANLNRALKDERSPAAFAESATSAWRAGFRVVKCTPFDEVTPYDIHSNIGPGLERLRSVLNIIPLANVAIDCHGRFHAVTLSQLLTELPHDTTPYWIEDPLAASDHYHTADVLVKHPEVRWAGGETANSVDEALRWMERPWLSIIMPDVKHMGGVSGVRTVMMVAGARGLWASCHNPSSPISTAISAHLSTIPLYPVPLEYPWGHQNIRQGATIPAEPIWDGAYHLSEEPGIGVAPNPEFLNEYGQRWRAGSWEPIR